MESIRKQNPPPPAAGSVPGWPLQGPFSRSPEARKVAPWVQGLSSVVHLSNLRHVVYRDAVKKACACSVFRRVAAMVKLNLVPGLHTLITILNQRYASITSRDHHSQGGKLQVLQHSTKWRIAALYEMRTRHNPPRMRLRPANVKAGELPRMVKYPRCDIC